MKPMRSVIDIDPVSLGTFVSLGSPLAAEACAVSGFDWLLIDLEHGAGDEAAMIGQIRAAAARDVPCVVRVESADRIRSGRVLDLGARGVMFPRLNTPDEVADAVRHLHFPPTGDRGVATYHPAAGFGLHPEWLTSADTDTICIVQIETADALDNVEAIAAVPGVDVIFVGPRDMSAALGVPGGFTEPVYLQALQRVAAAAHRSGIHAGILAANALSARKLISEGYTFVAIASDATLLATSAHQALQHVRTQ